MNKKIIKNIKGVTLVALVVTIIVLLILAGVAINLAIGNNGLFTRAKNAAEKWQEASDAEQRQLDEFGKLYDNTIKDLNIGNTAGGDGTGDGDGDDDKTKEELEKIIEELKSKQAIGNAEVGDVLEGKTFSNSDAIDVAGTMTNRGAVTTTVDPGKSYTIPEGYHNGKGKITATGADTIANLNNQIKVANNAMLLKEFYYVFNSGGSYCYYFYNYNRVDYGDNFNGMSVAVTYSNQQYTFKARVAGRYMYINNGTGRVVNCKVGDTIGVVPMNSTCNLIYPLF